jgi:multidrug efflux system outer membrane protein
MNRRLLSILPTVVALSACAGFPAAPRPVTLPDAVPLAVAADATAAGDGLTGGAWPEADWWRRYQDATLDTLIAAGLANAPTLQTAHARFEAARESVRLAGAASGAQVGLAGDLDRQRLSDNGLFPPELLGFHWYNQADLGLQFSYSFDWWGKQRAAIEAAVDSAHAVAADRSAAALALASSIAETYYGWQADQQRLQLAGERLALAERSGRIAADRVHADLDPLEPVRNATIDLAATREQIAALEGSARLRIVALAALVGRPADELPPLVAKPLPHVVGALPDNVRIDLIGRRADITASRWRVEAAEQNVKGARAQFYPDISINALAGLSAIRVDRLLEYGSRAPEAGLAVSLPIFDAGRLKARYRGSEAQLRTAIASYDQALVDAARDVATQLATRQQVLAQRAQRLIEVDAAERLRNGATEKLRQGLIDIRPEQTTAQALLAQRDALALLDAQALIADIGLQRALGGGYDAARPLANSLPAPGKATP